MFCNPNMRTKVRTPSGGQSKTQQQCKDDCDINKIYKHYRRFGVVPETCAARTPRYMDNSIVPDFQTAQNMMLQAREVFDKVPLEIRKLCDHNPAKVMDYINDPKNREHLEKLGMIKQPEVTPPDPLELLSKIAENTKKESSSTQHSTTT